MEDITKKQILRLVESLAAMRTKEEADVFLVCNGKEYPAHKLVLQASCPYFRGMFQSNMKETTAEKIEIHQVEPDAMEAVLDFLYLGNIPEIKTSDLLISLTEAADLFQLTELFSYCCDNLGLWISEKNFYKMLNIAVLHNLKKVLKSVLNFMSINIDRILTDPKFLNLPFEDLRGLLHSAVDRFQISEDLVLGVINWICQDAENRQRLAGELFQYINIKHLRREFMKFLLVSQDIRNMSIELISSIKDMALDVFYERSDPSLTGRGAMTMEPNSEIRLGAKLILFSEYRMMLSFDYDINCFVKRKVPHSCVQHLDLYTMTWLPAENLPFSGFEHAAMCQHKDLVYMVGGRLESMYVMYTVASNTAEYVTCNHFNRKEGCQLLPLGEHIYFVDKQCNVSQITPGKDCCVTYYYQSVPTWFSPKTFATANWIYITYYDSMNEDKSLKMIRFLCKNGQMRCESLTPVHNIPEGTLVSFTVSSTSNIMYGLYVQNNKLIRVGNKNPTVENWETEEFAMEHSKLFEVCSVYKLSQPNDMPLVFVTSDDDNQREIPNYLFEPETCEWTRLPLAKEKCQIPEDESHQKVYFIQEI